MYGAGVDQSAWYSTRPYSPSPASGAHPIRVSPLLHMSDHWQPRGMTYVPPPPTVFQNVPITPPALRVSSIPTVDGPLRWGPEALPLPCAYLRLPWPSGRSFARLLPSKHTKTVKPAALTYRQYVKKMMVEEVCSSPPLYLLRYVHFASAAADWESASVKTASRLLPFIWARKCFPGVQAISLQRWVNEDCEAVLPSQPRARIEFKSERFAHPAWDGDDIYTVFASLPGWDDLPISYRDLEQAFLESSVMEILDQASTCGSRKMLPRRKHLVLAYDCAGPFSQWSPHNMRQIVHLIGQSVSMLSSLIPLYLEPDIGSAIKTTHQSGGFASFQVVIYPPRRFNNGVNVLRMETQQQQSSLPGRGEYQPGMMRSVVDQQVYYSRRMNNELNYEDDAMIESDSDDDYDIVRERVLAPVRRAPVTRLADDSAAYSPRIAAPERDTDLISSQHRPLAALCGLHAKSPPTNSPPAPRKAHR